MQKFFLILSIVFSSIAISQTQSYTSEKNITETLSFLTDDRHQGRNTGSTEMENVMVFLENIFKKNQVKPYYQTYKDKISNYHLPAYNIIGMIEGNDPKLKNEFVIIGAHYDHIGQASNINGDTIANGANDNAVGTTAVAETIQYFAKTKTNKRSIIFVFFTAEEKGLLGSTHLAKKMKSEGIPIYFMFNFEMIGVPMKNKDMLVYITGIQKSNMAEKMNEYANKKVVGSIPLEETYNLFSHSDNFPYYTELKIPAHTISTFDFDNYQYYHHADDEFDKIDLKHVENVINTCTPILEKMINSPEKEIKLNEY